MDLYENKDKNLMTATFELPGLAKDNIQIDVQDGNLAVSGESSQSSEQREQGYAVKERKYGRFVRTIRLPDGTKVSNGFLFVSESVQVGSDFDGVSCVSVVQGHQGVDGERHFDRYLSEVLPRPGIPAHHDWVNEV